MLNRALVGVVVATTCGLASSPACLADGTVFTGTQVGSNGGGAFEFKIVSGFAGEQVEGGVNSTFLTFCLETGEHFNLNNTYWANVSTSVLAGTPQAGNFGNGANPAAHTTLEPETAFLYTKFREGALTSGNYGLTFSPSTNEIQAAIWLKQGQATQAWVNSNYNGTHISDMLTAASSAISSLTWAGIGNVRVINLRDGGGNPLQSHLVLIPLPTGTSMAGFGLLGMFGMGAIRRRRS